MKTLLNLNSIELACWIGWAVLLLPAVMYLYSWRIRRKFLQDLFSPETITLYYRQFFPFSPDSQLSEQERFKRDFDRLYGRRHYVLPLFLLALLSGLGMWVTARSVGAWLGLITTIKPFSHVVISAFLGAYAWVLYDQFGRFRTGDLTVHDLYNGVYRFLIAIPLGLSLATLSNVQAAAGVAFLLSAFPTATLFKISRRLASKTLGLGEAEEAGQLELEKLQCVSRTNAERYLEEGVSSIAELAWANPIDLAIRTNREFNFVVDSISQALLWVYLEDKVKKLYPLSLRGAQEVRTFLDDLDDSTNPAKQQLALQSLKKAASLMELDEEAFKYTLLVVKEDPYAEFLSAIWG
jgi:hypothetical protein